MREKKELASRLLALAAAGAMAFTAVGCGAAAEPQNEAEVAEPQAIEVETTTAVYDTIDRQTEFVGRLEAASSTKVYPSSAGKVLKVYAAPGEYVEAGELLFELDTEDLETAAETARLQYESTLSAADTSIISAKQNYDTLGDAWLTARDYEDAAEDAYDAAKKARDDAQTAVNEAQAAYDADDSDENLKALEKAKSDLTVAQNALTTASKNLDDMENSADSARKKMITARDTYYNTKGNEDEGIAGTVQTQVDLAKISYDNALKALNEAKVYAPVSGTISARNVGESDMVSAATPAFVIDQDGEAPVVSFNLSQDGAEALSVGDPVTVIYNGQEYSASITEIAGGADPTSGLYAAKAQTNETLGTSRSGGVVKVKASTAKAEDALVISLDLVEYDGNQPYVYVYRDGKAVRTDLVTGISSSEEVVVLEGLTSEDQIITTWHPDLKDGAAVTLKQQEGE